MRAIIPLALTMSACAPAQPPTATPDPLLGPCNAAPLARMVGRPWTDRLRAEALRMSHARIARTIRPGDMVTMDYRGDRLNAHLTAGGRIVRFECG